MTGDELSGIVTGLTPEQREQLARGLGGEVVAWLDKNVPGWHVQTEKEKNAPATVTPPKELRLVVIIWVLGILVLLLLAILYRN